MIVGLFWLCIRSLLTPTRTGKSDRYICICTHTKHKHLTAPSYVRWCGEYCVDTRFPYGLLSLSRSLPPSLPHSLTPALHTHTHTHTHTQRKGPYVRWHGTCYVDTHAFPTGYSSKSTALSASPPAPPLTQTRHMHTILTHVRARARATRERAPVEVEGELVGGEGGGTGCGRMRSRWEGTCHNLMARL